MHSFEGRKSIPLVMRQTKAIPALFLRVLHCSLPACHIRVKKKSELATDASM